MEIRLLQHSTMGLDGARELLVGPTVHGPGPVADLGGIFLVYETFLDKATRIVY